jgi:hypothetical protein
MPIPAENGELAGPEAVGLMPRLPSGLGLEAPDERCGRDVETGVAAPSQSGKDIWLWGA